MGPMPNVRHVGPSRGGAIVWRYDPREHVYRVVWMDGSGNGVVLGWADADALSAVREIVIDWRDVLGERPRVPLLTAITEAGAEDVADAEWAEAMAWLRSRPAEIQTLARRFPPSCRVRAVLGKRLKVPAPGRTGVVVSYLENGTVRVVHEDASPAEALFGKVGAECWPNWLEVVGYHQEPGRPVQDEAWVASVLAEPSGNPG